jgi:hypothetical protein
VILLFGLIRASLGFTLLLAGISKVAVRSEFTASATRFMPVSARRYARQVAVVAISVEIVAGFATLLIVRSRFLDTVDILLFAALFMIAIVGYRRYRGTPCRCFGALSKGQFNWLTIARNALLLLGACSLALFEPAQRVDVLALSWFVSAGAVIVVSAAFFQSAVVLAIARRGM